MSPIQILVVSIRALLRNKLRSFLTMLGVIIGVGAVVSITAIAAGAKARVAKTFQEMGSNMLIVRSGTSRMGGVRGGAGSELTLTWEDLQAIREEVPTVRHAAALLGLAVQAAAEGLNWSTAAQGTSPEYFEIRNWDIALGRVFSESDVVTGAKVCVIGQTVKNELFGPYVDPVGEIVRLNNVPFEIVGVAASKGQSGFGGDNDDVVFVPSTTFRAKLQGGLQQFIQGNIFVSATSMEATQQTEKDIETLLRRRHRLRKDAPDDFTVRNLSDIASAQEEGAQTMTSLLAGIALVSLIVGGIGIMNIMLVSVTERTREIGLRMAVGAKPRAILTQFLTEAIVLSVIGGLLGVAAGLGSAAYMVRRFDWPMLVNPDIIVVALSFSGVVGIAFGLYPAIKASRFDPIQALRYE